MVSLKNKKGFTIVELLIVIVVIGILATLVIVTFTGIQQKGRNTQRQTDIKALNGYVEAFYADYGFYPTLADMNSDTFRSAYMKGLDPAALYDPKQAMTDTSPLASAPADGTFEYAYEPTGTSCATTASTNPSDGSAPADTGCTSYTLTAQMEGTNTPDYVKKSN